MRDTVDVNDVRPWIERMADADHWDQLDVAVAWEKLATLIEDIPGAAGNAALAWMHSAMNYRAYTAAWTQAGAASRWDPDYRREGDQAHHRFQSLTGKEYAHLEPAWINTLVAGQPEESLTDSLAEMSGGEAHGEPSDLVLAARKVLSVYCRVAEQLEAAATLAPSRPRQ